MGTRNKRLKDIITDFPVIIDEINDVFLEMICNKLP